MCCHGKYEGIVVLCVQHFVTRHSATVKVTSCTIPVLDMHITL